MRIETGQQKYLNDLFGQTDVELETVRAELQRQDLDFMSISGAEARILQFFIRAMNLRKVVEVGTLFGYSALAMAKALPDDGQIFTLEKSKGNFAVAKKHFEMFPTAGRKIQAFCGDAVELLVQIESHGPFDLVFIDADKAGYVTYLDWAEKNVRSGGLIIGDNTFLWGAVYDEPSEDIGQKSVNAMKEFNQRSSDPTKYNSTLIPTVEGLTVAQKI